MRQAYDYWQDQPGNYPSGNPGWLSSERERSHANPLGSASFQRMLAFPLTFCTGNPLGRPRYTRPHGVGPVRPTETRSIFATSFHCFTLVSFRHTSRTVKSSPRNAKKIHQGRMILPNLSHYSWPKAISYNIHPFSRCLARDNLAASTVIFFPRYQPSKFAQLCSFSLKMPSFRTREHLQGRAYSYGPIQLNCSFGLSQRLPSY